MHHRGDGGERDWMSFLGEASVTIPTKKHQLLLIQVPMQLKRSLGLKKKLVPNNPATPSRTNDLRERCLRFLAQSEQ